MPIICMVIYLYSLHMYYCAFMSIIKHNVLKGEEGIVRKSSIRVSPPSLWVLSLWGPPRRNGLSVLIDIRAQPLQCQQRRLPTASPGLALEGIGQEMTHSCRPTKALRLKNHTSFLIVMFPFFDHHPSLRVAHVDPTLFQLPPPSTTPAFINTKSGAREGPGL